MVKSNQSLMKGLAGKGYKKYCDLQDKDFITHQMAVAELGGNVHSMVDAYKRYQQYRYPPFDGKMQEDYGVITRYLKKFWTLNKNLTRVEAYNQGLANLRVWIFQEGSNCKGLWC